MKKIILFSLDIRKDIVRDLASSMREVGYNEITFLLFEQGKVKMSL